MMKYYNDVLLVIFTIQANSKVNMLIRRCSRFNLFHHPNTSEQRGGVATASTPDRIFFTVNKPVILHGVQHFGSQGGEYTVSTRSGEISTDGSIPGTTIRILPLRKSRRQILTTALM